MNNITEITKAVKSSLAPLAAYPQFILWKLTERNGKQVKLPVDYRTAQVTDAHNPEAQADANTIIQTAKLFGPGYGVGFVFTPNDNFLFVDIDNCLEADNKTWSPVAMDIFGMLSGAAVEVSQSGRGLHIIGKCNGVIPEHACKNIPLKIELYHTGRFVALTGASANGSADTDLTANLPALIDKYFSPKSVTSSGAGVWTTEPARESNVLADDNELIQKALASKSAAGAFGSRATFADLWNGVTESLAAVYAPDESDAGEYDQSSADAALAMQLAFWTGKDCARIERLMWKSGLIRDKWKKHITYLRNTILHAVALCKNVYGESTQVVKSTEPVNSIEFRSGHQILASTQQAEYFTGCVYVRDLNRIFTPDGSLLNREQFNATYGGYIFMLDSGGSGKTTRKAWEAFTESQAINYPWAHGVCFRPELLK